MTSTEVKKKQSSHQVVVPATFERASRIQLLTWVNEFLKSKFTGIEELSGGDVYCLLNNVLFPNSVQLTQVKWNPIRETDSLANWRLLQTDWKKRGISKSIPYESLARGKFSENYEFLQWYKPFFLANYDGHPFDPLEMRSGLNLPSGGKGVKTPQQAQNKTPRMCTLNGHRHAHRQAPNDKAARLQLDGQRGDGTGEKKSTEEKKSTGEKKSTEEKKIPEEKKNAEEGKKIAGEEKLAESNDAVAPPADQAGGVSLPSAKTVVLSVAAVVVGATLYVGYRHFVADGAGSEGIGN